jgi:hypothetical protein
MRFFDDYRDQMLEEDSYTFDHDIYSKLFNNQALRVLFTMHSFGSSLPDFNFFQPPEDIGSQLNHVLECFKVNDATHLNVHE